MSIISSHIIRELSIPIMSLWNAMGSIWIFTLLYSKRIVF